MCGFESRLPYLDSEDYSEDGDKRRSEKRLYLLRQVSRDLQIPVPTATGVLQVCLYTYRSLADLQQWNHAVEQWASCSRQYIKYTYIPFRHLLSHQRPTRLIQRAHNYVIITFAVTFITEQSHQQAQSNCDSVMWHTPYGGTPSSLSLFVRQSVCPCVAITSATLELATVINT